MITPTRVIKHTVKALGPLVCYYFVICIVFVLDIAHVLTVLIYFLRFLLFLLSCSSSFFLPGFFVSFVFLFFNFFVVLLVPDPVLVAVLVPFMFELFSLS